MTILTLLLCSIWAATICASALCRAAKWGDRLGDNLAGGGVESGHAGGDALTPSRRQNAHRWDRSRGNDLPTRLLASLSPSPADLCIKPRTLGRLCFLNRELIVQL